MVRTKRNKQGAAARFAKAKSTPAAASASKPLPSIDSLVEKAQTLIAQCNYELAMAFLKRIIERDSAHVEAREMLGLALLETDEIDSAKQVFSSLVPPSPVAASPPSYSAHLYLAQLADDPNSALDSYKSGLALLTSQLKGKGRATEISERELEDEMKKTAVRTIISMVEIWMTDLCFEPQAESECETLLNLALEIDSENPEALQSLASVRISQQRPEEARQLAERSWALWKDLEPNDATLPPISSRLTLTRLLLELEQYTSALTIIQGILASDEQEVEAWYLQGWSFVLMGEAVKNGVEVEGLGELTWQELKQDARNCLDMCRELHVASKHTDAQILEHVDELIGELDASGFHSITEPEGDVAGAGDDEEWEDEDDDGDVDMS